AFLSCLLLIGVRLWFIQVKLADYYRSRTRGSSEVTVRVPSIRGEILDRNGIPLVTNRSSYEVDLYLPDIVKRYEAEHGQPPLIDVRTKDSSGMLHDRQTPDIVKIVNVEIVPKLHALGLAEEYSPETLQNHFRNDLLVPFTYRRNLDLTSLAKLAERNVQLPGVQLTAKAQRVYKYGALAAQILGYVGAPQDVSRMPDLKDFDFYDPDVEGKTNLEYSMDEVLRGKPGKRIFQRNARNQIEGEKQVVAPTPGANVYLTIDARIQYIVETTLRIVGRAGAVVVDPNNGQVLAMASVPSFDPNQFVPAISATDWAAIHQAKADPLTDRCIGVYAPGSTYKLVTALAGLSKGLANAKFTCSGGVSYGNTYMHCWGVHGRENLIEAITHSCDAYFYQFGNAAGIDAIDRIGKTLGLGQTEGIELTGEDPGLLPSAEWLRTVKNERWTPGQTANTSIGQGYVLTSPLQMAMVVATVANGGTVYQPTLILQTKGPDGTVIRRPARIRGDLTKDDGLSKDQIEIVRKGMFNVVNAPDGTGKKGAVPGVEVAGKTGTAQFWRNGVKDNHVWFLAFAPYDHPTIALAILVEGGKSGGDVAAPIAAEIIRKILVLDNGDDPGLKRIDPAVGNYNLVQSVDFQRDAVAQITGSSQDSVKKEPEVPRRIAKRATAVQPSQTPPPNKTRTAQNIFQRFFNWFRGPQPDRRD
ncbi:MAG: penicillin-binding protein 2, partial [Verrucomicrobia bacterium]|nr:penicillin-binding protein 2 [Verrucomicrobiota bacterium]